MGKRELLLIAGFVLVGLMVYYVTAPTAEPGRAGFSIGAILDHVRREMRGNRASAEVKSSLTRALKPGMTELRLETGTPLTIFGEDRKDVQFDLEVWSNGLDEAEARRYASETNLSISEAGSTLIVGMTYPKPAQQRASVTIRVPKDLAIRIQPTRSRLEISDVVSAELVEARGPATLRHITGRLAVAHRGGMLTLESVANVKLNTRGSTIVIKDAHGEMTVQMQGGELRGAAIAGPLEIESNNARIVLDDLNDMRKPLRVTAVGGSVSLAGLMSDARIDARDSRVDVAIEKPASIAIYTEGDEPMSITLPRGGFELDALAMSSRLFVPDGLLEVKTTDAEQRASGVIGGGGPTITLRSSRGDISIKLNNPDAK